MPEITDNTVEKVTPTDNSNATITPPWMDRWRESIAYMYVAVCVYDFVLAPLFNQAMSVILKLPPSAQIEWVPITLQGGAFFHLTIGGILGISSFMKGSTEKIVASNR